MSDFHSNHIPSLVLDGGLLVVGRRVGDERDLGRVLSLQSVEEKNCYAQCVWSARLLWGLPVAQFWNRARFAELLRACCKL